MTPSRASLSLPEPVNRFAPELVADPRFSSRDQRIANFVALTRTLAEAIAQRPRAAWIEWLEANDVPFAPMHRIEEVPNDPQVRHLGTFRTLHATC